MGSEVTGALGSDSPSPAPQDLQLFQEAGGWDVVSAVAEFWCSRVEWSPEEEKYHLKGETVGKADGHLGVGRSRKRGSSGAEGAAVGDFPETCAKASSCTCVSRSHAP